MKNRIVPVITVLTTMLLYADTAHAHGLIIYASTPISPPATLIWVPLAFVALVLIGDWLAFRGTPSMGGLLLKDLGCILLFATVFIVLGAFFGAMNTAPPPGLGAPSRPLEGTSWNYLLPVFIGFNVVGLLIWGITRWQFLKVVPMVSGNKRRAILGLGLGIYVLALLPFLFTDAIAHGWAGGYVHSGCRYTLKGATEALVRYEEAKGQLPRADSFTELDAQLEGYGLRHRPMLQTIACPVLAAFDEDPPPYQWNTALNGKTLRHSDLDPATPILTCPHHQDYIQTLQDYQEIRIHLEERGQLIMHAESDEDSSPPSP